MTTLFKSAKVKLDTLISFEELILKNNPSICLYRRFYRLTKFIKSKQRRKIFIYLIRQRFNQDYNERCEKVIQCSRSYTKDDILHKSVNTLNYLNKALSYTDKSSKSLLMNLLDVEISKKKYFKSELRKDILIKEKFEKFDIHDISKQKDSKALSLTSYRDFERTLMMLNESSNLCL
ncbi:hypothetical protein WICMUC_003178 [Wickerhamomyces mucosus]|uniref:Uncharacterized protein n=1 Tax=Wickerhamomyces mucosus TaxID=1378264 RepID=A0A9P8PMJ2_9ASCO|nr:hypothetical protein WICMUC_003178 [Wickerhamomyces mucosus]